MTINGVLGILVTNSTSIPFFTAWKVERSRMKRR